MQSLGLEQLQRRAAQRALAGGFARGIVLELNVCSGPSVGQQLDRLASTESCTPLILAFMGVEDLPAPRAWMHISSNMSITDDVLLCSDEELQWGAEPVRIGQRQFFGQPTPFRVISRGQVPGLVAVKVELITDLEFQTSYISLHAFLKDLGLQWIARNRAVRILPQALLRRSFAVKPVCACNFYT